ncbi:helix-turn-helix domain-containing protein [Streptacidiphilus sp. PB12-B1b]|uniref:helix-turn-helix domain-containing protein n=1 Tax=Streptacidiphilus sp. PB12-B1b TaxID=2705012 RepID=UPI0015F8B6EF|nr:helix-turn-helix domain-containing protein [Streptacidiphilus sp. PB12-B1b]QMU77493.1 helix-turn-helix domain-containing protein [Streptacidiphilus sp. PB12-B1b]
MLKTVAAVLIDGFAPFEFGVLCEVFGIDRTDDGVPAFDYLVCGEHPGRPLRTNLGFDMIPPHGLDALAGADLVGVPAATMRDSYPPAVLDALRAAADRGATLMSVCSGAYVLGAAGLLDGRACTTHWRYVDDFARRFPLARVDPNVLFVDDGTIVTSAGTAAGIDACLHLVRRELGSAPANAIARRMVVPPQRDGGQKQYIQLPVPECTGDSLQPVLTWMMENLAVEHSVPALARRARMSERTFARRFGTETGTTPHRWLTRQRVLHAQHLLEDTALSIEEIARVTGMGTGALLRHHFRQIVGVTPKDYRWNFADRTGAPSA